MEPEEEVLISTDGSNVRSVAVSTLFDPMLAVSRTFDTTKEDLKAAVAPLQGLSISGDTDTTWYEQMAQAVERLAKMRTAITKTGKKWRDAANAYNKAVLALEKDLLHEVTPLEEQYKEQLRLFDHKQWLRTNATKLIDRKAALDRYQITWVMDNDIIAMTDDSFSKFIVDACFARNQAIRDKERAEQILQEGIAIGKAQVQTVPEEVATKDTYQQWLDENGYTPDTHTIIRWMHDVKLYKLVSSYQI